MSASPSGWFARGAGLALGLVSLLPAASRTVTMPVEGLRDASPRVHALVGARIVVAPGKVIESGTLVLRDGLIETVGAGVKPPADARVWDVTGKTLYAGFIESGTTLFLPDAWKPAATPAGDGSPAATPTAPTSRAGTYAWNPRVTPERAAGRVLIPDAKGAEKLRALGFTAVNSAPARGIFRGSSRNWPRRSARVERGCTAMRSRRWARCRLTSVHWVSTRSHCRLTRSVGRSVQVP